MSRFLIEEILIFLKNVLEVSPAKGTALILRDDYQEQIDVADPDDVAAHGNRAMELLAWRSTQAAVHIFKKSKISQYFDSARGEDLAALYCCEALSERYPDEVGVRAEDELAIPVALPPDEDLVPIPGLIQLTNVSPTAGWITLWGEWTDLLGEPPERVDWVNAVANALSEGRKRALREKPLTSLTELFENVENIQSLQTILADLIEKLIARIEGSATDQAYSSLQSILGRRLDGLCREAQAALTASEQIRLSKDFADPVMPRDLLLLGRPLFAN